MIDFQEVLSALPNSDPDVVQIYLDFITTAVPPLEGSSSARHHILPRALFPQYGDLNVYPWNAVRLSLRDHLVAHFYLYAALRDNHSMAAFKLMVGLVGFNALRKNGYDPDLLDKMADEYQKAKENVVWMINDELKCIRVCKDDVSRYEGLGYKLGFHDFVSTEGRQKNVEGSKRFHRFQRTLDKPYETMPRGDNHHRRVLGISPETRAKISATLKNYIFTDDHRRNIGDGIRGKKWCWSDEAREANHERLSNHENLVRGYWEGKTRPPEACSKTSASLKKFHTEHPGHVKYNTGEAHHYYGKHRDEETRAKISQTLTGLKQSDESRRLKSIALTKARWPQFPPEDLETFKYIWENRITDPVERKWLLKQAARVSYQMIKGLYMIIDDTTDGVDKRYWRQARFWINHIYASKST